MCLFSCDFDQNRHWYCWKRHSVIQGLWMNTDSYLSVENIIICHTCLTVCVCACSSLSVMSGITHCCRDAQSCVFLSFKAPGDQSELEGKWRTAHTGTYFTTLTVMYDECSPQIKPLLSPVCVVLMLHIQYFSTFFEWGLSLILVCDWSPDQLLYRKSLVKTGWHVKVYSNPIHPLLSGQVLSLYSIHMYIHV